MKGSWASKRGRTGSRRSVLITEIAALCLARKRQDDAINGRALLIAPACDVRPVVGGDGSELRIWQQKVVAVYSQLKIT